MPKMKTVLLCIITCCFSVHNAFSENVLDERYSFTFRNVTILESLHTIEEEAGLGFAYDLKHFESHELINRSFHKSPLRNILSNLLGDKLNFELVGERYIAIYKPSINRIKKNIVEIGDNSPKPLSITKKELIEILQQFRNIKDSVRIIDKVVMDTTHVVVRDTLFVKLEDNSLHHLTIQKEEDDRWDRNSLSRIKGVKLKKFTDVYGLRGSLRHQPDFDDYFPSIRKETTVLGNNLLGVGFLFGLEGNLIKLSFGVETLFMRNEFLVSRLEEEPFFDITMDTISTIIRPEGVSFEIVNDTVESTRDVQRNEVFNNHLTLLSLPVSVGVFKDMGKLGLELSSGLSGNIAMSQSISIPISNEGSREVRKVKFFMGWMASASISYGFSTKSKLLLSPRLTGSVGSIYNTLDRHSNGNLMSFGLSIGYRKYL